MTIKNIKKLVGESYNSNGMLEEETALYIAQNLSRSNLKKYITVLREEDKKRSVIVKSPAPLSPQDQKSIESLYPDKKIDYLIDPSLLLGTEIVNYDIVYTRNLKNTFEELLTHVESYD